jgi:beta-fructofuranosidase
MNPEPTRRCEWSEGSPAPEAPAGFGAADFTLMFRLGPRPSPGPLVRLRARGGRTALLAELSASTPRPELACLVSFDFKEEPLRVSFPLAALPAAISGVHVVLRRRDACLELLADGVLVDEEWPLGRLLATEGPVEIGGKVPELSLCTGATPDDELAPRVGGRSAVAARAERILGPERPIRQYWRPRGFNVNVGDCMPYFHGGRFHLFYLLDRRGHGSRWGLGGHQWAHASTGDLGTWEHHPLAVPLEGGEDGSICTGSVFFHGGVHHAFYSVRAKDGGPAPLRVSTSTDGIHFAKQPVLGHVRAPFIPKDARDPVVFATPEDGRFHMLVTTGLAGVDGAGGGCLARLVSADLRRWEQVDEPFLVPGLPGQPECADLFEWNGWHYLLFSNHAVTRYRMARHPLGPWTRPPVDEFEGPPVCVMKTAGFHGGRRIGAAFSEDGGWGGRLVLREILQRPDGTLASGWPPELPLPPG